MTTGKSDAAKPSRRHLYTFWMVRDSDFGTGELHPRVRVWLSQPKREGVGAGAYWRGAKEGDLYAEWTIDQCIKNARIYPEDDRQCICVTGDSVRGEGDLVS